MNCIILIHIILLILVKLDKKWCPWSIHFYFSQPKYYADYIEVSGLCFIWCSSVCRVKNKAIPSEINYFGRQRMKYGTSCRQYRYMRVNKIIFADHFNYVWGIIHNIIFVLHRKSCICILFYFFRNELWEKRVPIRDNNIWKIDGYKIGKLTRSNCIVDTGTMSTCLCEKPRRKRDVDLHL